MGVDVLKAGVDVFLTHGGQNSFSEAMSQATPVGVCPGFGDQKVNSRKAVDLGVGMKVDRPDPDAGSEAAAVAAYKEDVCNALKMVLAKSTFRTNAESCRERLKQAGGVPHAIEVVLAQAQMTTPAVGPCGGA